MKFTQLKETCIYAADLEKIKDFYGELLGLPVISYLKDKHVFFRSGTSVLLCFNPEHSKTKQSPPGHYAHGKLHFAFEVVPENYEETKKEIIDKGIIITDTVVWENEQESFYFEDPAGNVLEVVPMGIWG